MALFTFVTDYQGGTFVSQASGDDPVAASMVWTETFTLDDVVVLTDECRGSMREKILRDDLCPLQGMLNLWCLTFLIEEHLALVHVIATMP